jgi:DNA uptake protein ComE-like DNA-binding protein
MTDTINLNSADKDALDSIEELKGHGHEIVRYREERGGFRSLRELDEVPGLTGKFGEETLKRLTI